MPLSTDIQTTFGELAVGDFFFVDWPDLKNTPFRKCNPRLIYRAVECDDGQKVTVSHEFNAVSTMHSTVLIVKDEQVVTLVQEAWWWRI